MKSILHLVAVLPFLSNSAFAQSTVNCNTVLGTKSVTKVPTTTVTSTASGRPTQLLALQSTVTSYQPSTSTSMLLRTRTVTVTDSTITDTFSTTTTLYEVQTMTNTQTTTTTTTQTSTDTSTSTTVIATTEGFRNIADTLNSDQLRRRAAQNPHGVVKRALQTGKVGAQAILATQFPAAVTCKSPKPGFAARRQHQLMLPSRHQVEAKHKHQDSVHHPAANDQDRPVLGEANHRGSHRHKYLHHYPQPGFSHVNRLLHFDCPNHRHNNPDRRGHHIYHNNLYRSRSNSLGRL